MYHTENLVVSGVGPRVHRGLHHWPAPFSDFAPKVLQGRHSNGFQADIARKTTLRLWEPEISAIRGSSAAITAQYSGLYHFAYIEINVGTAAGHQSRYLRFSGQCHSPRTHHNGRWHTITPRRHSQMLATDRCEELDGDTVFINSPCLISARVAISCNSISMILSLRNPHRIKEHKTFQQLGTAQTQL